MEKKPRLPKKIAIANALAATLSALAIPCSIAQSALLVADDYKIWRPDYEKKDLSPIMNKGVDNLTDDDYSVLYAQTGLTKIGVMRALKNGENGKRKISEIQTAYFAEHKIKHDTFAPFICFCEIEDRVPTTYVETGDIIVNPSTNLAGWRMGHSALISSPNGDTAEITSIGTVSGKSHISLHTNRIAFMILSPKVDTETREKVVNYAKTDLFNIPYNPLRGIFTSKDKIDDTQCAHFVWYAYKHFGIELDSNGGGLVIPKDFANSDNVEVVQVFGFDPVKLWK